MSGKENPMTTQPAHKVKIGLITATIWKNESFYSVDISRSFKNNEGSWQSTTSFGHNDLLNLSKCVERAEIWVARQSNASK